MRFRVLALPMLALVAACSQSDAPSEKMEKAAEELVQSVTESADEKAAQAALGPFAPRNECSEMAGADAFLSAFGAAVELRDTELMTALAAQDIKLGFGGEDGVENLRQTLDAEGSTMWDELAALTTLGCAANEQGGITMPYYFAQDMQLDPFESYIVTGNRVALRSAPGDDAPVLTEVSWAEVELIRDDNAQVVSFGGEDGNDWVHVRLPEAGEQPDYDGYIRSGSLRSPIDYRLIAASRNGRWRIIALLAGD